MIIDFRTILKSPLIYSNYQKLVGGYRARRKFVENYLDLNPDQRLLDFGCGPGDILEFLPKLEYTGIDIDPNYIKKAQKTYGHRATFICSELSDVDFLPTEHFDIVIATGVLHHMTDKECNSFIKWAQSILKPNGKLLTLDGCYTPKQNKISKYLLDKDRGQYVRSEEHYINLMSKHFNQVTPQIEESYFHIPYTLLIMSAQNI